MAITVLSKQNNTLFCSIRKEYVVETPEERVRQSVLATLFSLGYPASLIVVERKIADLPARILQSGKVPNRRVDILCYKEATLEPLLLVECKSKVFNDKELRQLLGYNFYIQAQALALVNSQKVQLFDASGCALSDAFPKYTDF